MSNETPPGYAVRRFGELTLNDFQHIVEKFVTALTFLPHPPENPYSTFVMIRSIALKDLREYGISRLSYEPGRVTIGADNGDYLFYDTIPEVRLISCNGRKP